jgi:amidase
MKEIIAASATALAKAIRDREVSSEEVVNAYLKRMRAVNPKLNAVVQELGETACEQARAADRALARGASLARFTAYP